MNVAINTEETETAIEIDPEAKEKSPRQKIRSGKNILDESWTGIRNRIKEEHKFSKSSESRSIKASMSRAHVIWKQCKKHLNDNFFKEECFLGAGEILEPIIPYLKTLSTLNGNKPTLDLFRKRMITFVYLLKNQGDAFYDLTGDGLYDADAINEPLNEIYITTCGLGPGPGVFAGDHILVLKIDASAGAVPIVHFQKLNKEDQAIGEVWQTNTNCVSKVPYTLDEIRQMKTSISMMIGHLEASIKLLGGSKHDPDAAMRRLGQVKTGIDTLKDQITDMVVKNKC